MHNGIDIKGDFDLWDTTRGGRDTREFELAEQVIVLSTGTLTLVYLDEHPGLVVGISREAFRFLGGHGRVTLDECCHNATSGLDSK